MCKRSFIHSYVVMVVKWFLCWNHFDFCINIVFGLFVVPSQFHRWFDCFAAFCIWYCSNSVQRWLKTNASQNIRNMPSRAESRTFPTYARLQIAVGRIDVNLINRFIQMWSVQTRVCQKPRCRLICECYAQRERKWKPKKIIGEKKVHMQKSAWGARVRAKKARRRMREIVTKFKWLNVQQRQGNPELEGKKKKGRMETEIERHNANLHFSIYVLPFQNHVHILSITSNFWYFALTSKNIGNWKQISNTSHDEQWKQGSSTRARVTRHETQRMEWDV